MGDDFPARAWGVEHLTPEERLIKALDAGADQFGGEHEVDMLARLVETGLVVEARLDESARRLLAEKFLLGLFDDPFIDERTAIHAVGSDEAAALGAEAQRAAIAVLANDGSLPFERGTRIYVEGIDLTAAASYGTVVDQPEDADLAIIRLAAPYDKRETTFEGLFHAGSLDFPGDVIEHVRSLSAVVPTIIDVFLDRPAVLHPLLAASQGLVASWGSSDEALLDVLSGAVTPRGKLPFDIPSSMTAVRESRPDVPFDTADPTFRTGHGLTWVVS